MSGLANKIALVTGAGRGIGRAIALRLAQDGASVAVLDQDASSAAVAGEIEAMRGTALALPGTDVSQFEQVSRAITITLDHFGRIDILVNNASIAGGNGDFLDISLELWQRIVGVNLTGMFLCGQAVARHMRAAGVRGRIINIGSINSFGAERGAAAYVTAKHGTLGLTRAMAVDLAPHGITVNCIAPGPITVERNAELFAGPLREPLARRVPLGHTGTPDQVATAVAFLACDDASFITGAALAVDGGTLAYLNFE